MKWLNTSSDQLGRFVHVVLVVLQHQQTERAVQAFEIFGAADQLP